MFKWKGFAMHFKDVTSGLHLNRVTSRLLEPINDVVPGMIVFFSLES